MAYPDSLAGAYGALFVGTMLVIGIIVAVAVYVYSALAWITIAKKLQHKRPWLAWIPFANIALMLQLGGFGWGWVFLILVPILGWIALAVLLIIATWRVYEKRKYPGWLALIPILQVVPILNWIAWVANLVVIGLVAWADRK